MNKAMYNTKRKAAAVAVVMVGASGTAALGAYIHQQTINPQSVQQENAGSRTDGSDKEPCPEMQTPPPKYVPGTYPSLPLYNTIWLSANQLINPNSQRVSLINTTAGTDTPLDAVNAVVQEQEKNAAGHQEMPFFPSCLHLSPDGRWLLWPAGTKEHPIWEAERVDGTERREWNRKLGGSMPIYTGGGVAWMRDSTHWVEVDEKIRQGEPQCYVRLYSLDSPTIHEFPLKLTPGPDTRLPPFPQFLFTTDGHAWMVANSGGGTAVESGVIVSNAEYYELLPGPDVWTLRHTTMVIQATHAQALSDNFELSPDGQWLVWRDNSDYADKRARIILSRPDGTEERTLFETTSFLAFLHWTPDGKKIVFHWDGNGGISNAPNGEGMYTISLDNLTTCAFNFPKRTAKWQAPLGLFPTKAGQRWETLIAKNIGR